MTHLTAHRNGILCLLAVVAIAGCGTQFNAGGAPARSAAPVSAAATAASSAPSPGSRAVAQQVTSIDQQLSAVDGQLAAANSGLSTTEGDPAQ